MFRFTQQEIARNFGFSLSTVNFALKTPTAIGAIRKETKFFVLQDFKKLLYYWASFRNLERDLIYRTHFPESIHQIEGLVPPDAVYAGYSAFAKITNEEAPSDYSKVYFYLDGNELSRVIDRFPKNAKKEPNVFVLKIPEYLKGQKVTDITQTFVDIWNMGDWYAKEFIGSLEEKITSLINKFVSGEIRTIALQNTRQ